MKKILLAIGLALLTQQCDKEEDDKDKASKADKTSSVANCPDAVTAFTNNIQPAIDGPIGSSCADSSCHVSGAATPIFVKGASNAANNRSALITQENDGFWKEADNLYKKITDTHTFPESRTKLKHDGGNKPWFPSQLAIKKWTDAEAECT